MKLGLFLLLLAGAYTYIMLSLADGLVVRTSNLHASYDHVATTADHWAQGDTSTSFVPPR